jgi:predicted DsbA family dithiol-disulfide isomerase
MIDEPTLWYFAYGSNMSPGTFVERRRMRPLATRWGWLAGYRLCFDLPIGPGERGCASVTAAPDARVAGVLYRIGHADADRLDRTELGYRRVPIEVEADGGERIEAFTYQSAVSRPGRRPSRRYLDLLLDGARTHALPAAYVAWLDGFDLAFDERGAGGATIEERTVRFYFAYDSEAAYRVSTQLADAIGSLGVAIDYTPICAPSADGDRRACAGFLFARAEGRGRAYHDLVYESRHRDGLDVGRVDTLARIAERSGLERARFIAALDDPGWAAHIEENQRRARAHGIRDCPAFVFRGQSFAGDGAIASLVQAIRSTIA